ncbi:helix-turn-helix domain-containing protein [Sulfurimonas sp.]|uniref:helix-turn-helix domain-containing protein n=1 Tax=Sulfurimonas sp. TaxID=2022749 RepID=UPI00356B131B
MENDMTIDKDKYNEIYENLKNIINLLQNMQTNAPNDVKYVTVAEAAQITKLSEQKIRQMIDEGTIKINPDFGRAKRIYIDSL